MRWKGERQSDNVEDFRGSTGRGGGLPIGRGGLSIGGIVIALVAGWIFGINPLTILGLMSGGEGVTQSAPEPGVVANDEQTQFARTVLASTEDVWTPLFKAQGSTYQAPKLRLFRGEMPTACGYGAAAMGPFYCPGDRSVYIDLTFFDTLSQRLGAPGEFAQAYVIAHEVGHHVQNLMGLTDKVDQARASGRISEAEANQLSVRLELQADCFAGVWANQSQAAKKWLDQADVESAINAASRIGDDTLQRQSRGTVVPDSFTHGTSAQRVNWLKRGLQTGDVQQCDTFSAAAV